MINLTGADLTPADVARLARRASRPRVAPASLRRLAAARPVAEHAIASRTVYGHTTGVGANRTTDVADGDPTHGIRLLRSHAGDIGDVLPVEQARAMLAVRLNQLLNAGTAVDVGVVERLADALESGHVPTVRAYGGVGTADLGALAELGLTLAGERPWRAGDGPPPEPVPVGRWDALPLMSSSALTIGRTCLGHVDLRALLDQVPLVAALSLMAVRGSVEPYAAAVHRRRPHPGATATAARMRELTRPHPWQPRLVQDPYGFRCLPQVHGAALDASDALDRVLMIEANAAAENPLLDTESGGYFHHGGFHQASLALALDQLRLAALGTAQLSASRLVIFADPEYTDTAPFLAAAADGSSGTLILEYAAHAALADLRSVAQPVTLGHAVLSRGVEDHASFADAGAARLTDTVAAFRWVLACELVVAIRALRTRDAGPTGDSELARFHADAAAVLDPRTEDRGLTADVVAAAELLSGPR
jgi:histidine ammonia-lyase